MTVLWVLVLSCLFLAAESGTNSLALLYDQLLQTLVVANKQTVELTIKYARLHFSTQLGTLLSVSRDQSLQYCQQHVTRDTTLYITYMTTLYPRCYTAPRNNSTCPVLTLHEYCFESVNDPCINLTRHSLNCFEDERLRVTNNEHVTRVVWIEELRLLTNQMAADHVELLQIAERGRDAQIGSESVSGELNTRVTRVKESVRQIVAQLSVVGMDFTSTLTADQCALYLAQLSIDLSAMDVTRVDNDPVTAAFEHVIDTLWRVTLCHTNQIDTSALITCSQSFSESCWNSVIATIHPFLVMNATRDTAEIFDTWFQVPFSHVYFSCWSSQWSSVFDMLTAVTTRTRAISPNIDISTGTAISGSRDQCAYYASTRQLLRHEFDFGTFELRVTQVTANQSVPLYNVLSGDSNAFIALISNATNLRYEQPSEDFLPNMVISFDLHHTIPSVTPVTPTTAPAPVTKRAALTAQCSAGQYLTLDLGTYRCVTCPVGSFCPGDDIRYLCSNAPQNISEYTSAGVVSATCPFICSAGYYQQGDTCQTVPPGYTVNPLNTSQLILCDTILPHTYYEFLSSGCKDQQAKYSAVLLPQRGYSWEEWVALLTIIRHNFKLSTWLFVNMGQTQARGLNITLLHVDQIWQLNLLLNLETPCLARLELRGAQTSVQSDEISCPMGTWHHIAVEGDLQANSISFYVNGVLSGTEYYAPWSYPASVNGDLDAKNSIFRPVFMMRVKEVTAPSDSVHVTVAIDNLIIAVAANDSAPYLATSSYTQLIDRWHRNPLENRVAQCQQQYEQIALDVTRQPHCLPHCPRDSVRNLTVIDRLDGVAVVEDVTPVNIACQTATSTNDPKSGPRSLSHLSKVSKCDSHSVAQWPARYLVVTPVNESLALTEITIINALDEVVSILGYQLVQLSTTAVINISSVNVVSRDQQLVIDLGAEIQIDRMYLFLVTATPFSVAGLLSRDAPVTWHLSISDPYAVQSELNPRATVIDERHRFPNQAITCVSIDPLALALAPRTSFSDCQCLNLAPNITFDMRTGCQPTEIDAMTVPKLSISDTVVPSQKFSLDFYFGQPAAWSLQLFDHVISVRDFIQVTVGDDSGVQLTRVKYRLVSPPITTATLALPNIVRVNLTVTAVWHRPGHVMSAPVTQRYELLPQVPAVETEPKIAANTTLMAPLTVSFRVSDTSEWPSTELDHVIVLTLSFTNGTSITSQCAVTCQLVVTSSIHVRAVAMKADWLNSEARDWSFTVETDPPGLCDGYIWLCGLGFSILGGGLVTAVILVLGWRLDWFKFKSRD